jgi:hypothetical protein
MPSGKVQSYHSELERSETDPVSIYYIYLKSELSESTLSVRYKLSRVGFVLKVPLLVLAVSLRCWVQLRRSRLRNHVTPFFFFSVR